MRLRASFLCLLALGCSDPEPPAERPSTPSLPSTEAARTPAEVRRAGNHLVGEASPYLAQHDHNPVDWYPWGEEALARASTLNRPILLSIGYSTCHWCHVMAHESFEDDEIAAYVNEHFVAIKVDREQRPDVDALYLDAVRAMGGSTGWPLTVVLTPDLVPFYGGTYFPRDRFLGVLRRSVERFENEGAAVGEPGRRVFAQIEAASRRDASELEPVDDDALDLAFRALAPARDMARGGFGSRQKFPNAPLLLAELRRVERTGDARAREHLVRTLDEMARGGIRDPLGGSFHRYAVDPAWHVPHFEKTLYDNAQLAQVYVEAGRALERPDLVAVGRAVLDDLVSGWQRPDGGFVVGFDADDPNGEGAYYTWTPAELRAALGDEDGARFATTFGVTDAGEPSLEGRSVLHRASAAALRIHLQATEADADALLRRAAPRLLEVRRRRPAPAIDDKELTGWNGLAILALANAGRWLDEPRYVAAAQRAARFVVDRCWDGRRMLRGMRDGASLGEGFLEDYALAALGLLRLHAADGDLRWLDVAQAIARVVLDRFHDPERATFDQSAREDTPEGLPLRRPDEDDGVLPSGGSAATLLLLELGAMSGDRGFLDAGERAARRAADRAVREPFASGYALVALDHLVGPRRELVVAGDAAPFAAILRDLHLARVLPVRIAADGVPAALLDRFPALEGKRALEGRPTAYVCEIGRCELPTSDPAVLARQLAAARVAGTP